jgi:hypothetical protein
MPRQRRCRFSRHLCRGIDDVDHLEALGWRAMNRYKSSTLLREVCVDSRRYQRSENVADELIRGSNCVSIQLLNPIVDPARYPTMAVDISSLMEIHMYTTQASCGQ